MASYLDEIPDNIALNGTTFEAISQSGPIDGSGERFRNKYEFDVSNPDAYEQAWSDYQYAWDVYLGTSGENFAGNSFDGTTEVEGEALPNPQVLLQAINFYIYTAGEDPAFEKAQEESLTTQVSVSGNLQAMDRYARDDGQGVATYENPNAFYDPEVYDRLVDASDPDSRLPKVTLDGSQTLSNKYEGLPVLEVLTTEEKNSTEYESVINGPSSEYGWGSPYATGGKLAREV